MINAPTSPAAEQAREKARLIALQSATPQAADYLAGIAAHAVLVGELRGWTAQQSLAAAYLARLANGSTPDLAAYLDPARHAAPIAYQARLELFTEDACDS